MLLIWDVFSGRSLDEAGVPSALKGQVDVRDVARFVTFSVEHPDQTNGERYILASANGPAQSVADILREAYPDRRDTIQKGTPGEGYILPGYTFPKELRVDASKASKAMGPYIPWNKTVLDTARSMEHLL